MGVENGLGKADSIKSRGHSGGLGLQVGVIGRAHQRAAGGVGESHPTGGRLIFAEDIRMNKAPHRQMSGGGAEILPDRQHFHIVGAQVLHSCIGFLVRFAESDHDAGLGRRFGKTPLEFAQQVEGVGVVRAGARHFVKARDGFEIVIENIGGGDGEGVEGFFHSPAKVRREDFDPNVGRFFANGANALGEVGGAAVAQVVAVHAGDDDIGQAQFGGDTRQIFGLGGVGRVGASVGDIAKRTAAGAQVAQNHKGCGSFAKAFADIGAGRLFADGVQFVPPQDALDFGKARVVRRGGANPLGLARLGVLHGHDLDGIAGGLFRSALANGRRGGRRRIGGGVHCGEILSLFAAKGKRKNSLQGKFFANRAGDAFAEFFADDLGGRLNAEVGEADDGEVRESAGVDILKGAKVAGGVQGNAVIGASVANAESECGDFCAVNVDAGLVGAGFGGDLELILEEADDGILEQGDQSPGGDLSGAEVEESVGDGLSGGVIGGAPSAVGRDDGNIPRIENIFADGGLSEGVDGVMLQSPDFLLKFRGIDAFAHFAPNGVVFAKAKVAERNHFCGKS